MNNSSFRCTLNWKEKKCICDICAWKSKEIFARKVFPIETKKKIYCFKLNEWIFFTQTLCIFLHCEYFTLRLFSEMTNKCPSILSKINVLT